MRFSSPPVSLTNWKYRWFEREERSGEDQCVRLPNFAHALNKYRTFQHSDRRPKKHGFSLVFSLTAARKEPMSSLLSSVVFHRTLVEQ